MMSNQRRDRYRNLAESIMQFEAYGLMGKKKQERKYLHIFKVSKEEEREEKEEWEGKIKDI